MKDMPLLSIIVPVYNAEEYLERCVMSISSQDYKNLEIILINDGSTDNSGKICDAFSERDSRIFTYHITNGGSSIARNFGLEKSNGEYIGFVDSDDWIRPEMYLDLLTFAIDKNLLVVECSSVDSTNLGNNNSDEKIKKAAGLIESKNQTLLRVIKNKRFAVWRRIYKREVIQDRFFKEHVLHQDVYYTIDILNDVDKIGFIDKPYYVYNVENENSVIRSKYSLKKLKSIGAAEYVVLKTEGYSNSIKFHARRYLFYFLTSHYNNLYLNNHLDKNYAHRVKIKDLLKKYHASNNFDFYVLMIIILPKYIYKYFLRFNRNRIDFQNKINLKFKNV